VLQGAKTRKNGFAAVTRTGKGRCWWEVFSKKGPRLKNALTYASDTVVCGGGKEKPSPQRSGKGRSATSILRSLTGGGIGFPDYGPDGRMGIANY